MVFDVQGDLESLSAVTVWHLDMLTLLEVDVLLMREPREEVLRYLIVDEGVPSQLEFVEVLVAVQDVLAHAPVVHEVDLEATDALLLNLGLDDPQTRVIVSIGAGVLGKPTLLLVELVRVDD